MYLSGRAIVVVILLAAGGCGQKGPLYFPPAETAGSSAEEAERERATTPATPTGARASEARP